MGDSFRSLRSVLPLLLVLAIALTFLTMFLRRAGLFSESVTLSAETLQIAPATTDDPDPSATPAEEVTLEIITLLPKDGIPAIFDPEFVSAQEADGFLLDTDQVMGVVIDGDARAYGTAFLSNREVVNDTVGGRAITVTW
jgi:hypothetical protein